MASHPTRRHSAVHSGTNSRISASEPMHAIRMAVCHHPHLTRLWRDPSLYRRNIRRVPPPFSGEEGRCPHTPAQHEIRANLSHPIVDGDGHWLEYAPVFSEKMRKAGGDKGADGFLAALKSTTDALKLQPAERARRGVAQPNFWNRQAENTLDRATAMMPKLLY